MAENLLPANSSGEDDASYSSSSNEMSVDDDIDLITSRQDALMIFSQHAVKKIQAKKGMSQQQVMALTKPKALEEVELFFGRIADLPFCFDRHNKKFSKCKCLQILILDYHEVKLIASFVCKCLISYCTMHLNYCCF
jgi:hypothetical protein